jgi:NAD(P) transhydrogenase subunit alpha
MTDAPSSLTIGIPRETFPDERRVAIIPDLAPSFTKLGFTVYLESGAGEPAGYADSLYSAKDIKVVKSRDE